MTKGDNWQHQIRVEAILTPESNCFYPVCIDGKRACPPEDCGGPWEFMAQKQEYSVRHIASRLSEIVEEGDIPGNIEEIYELTLTINYQVALASIEIGFDNLADCRDLGRLGWI
ncbi:MULTISPECIES: IS1096 element passenger TnpR family protein [unclassified Anabaena]|uniref:IS1096 element passenger TnpR family protein n=1 Tax=unclassified Anabaena TaxID=2619674 RepID=UPI002B21D303|nr:hypothetical protein [Anabaena sp. UHCC 0399]MEA5569218.1 hypothetical protein [Anabaena sp. UHCC 0399]